MKFSNQTKTPQGEKLNPQTAAIMLSYGFSGKSNGFRWAQGSRSTGV
jgi:hypothetical protein